MPDTATLTTAEQSLMSSVSPLEVLDEPPVQGQGSESEVSPEQPESPEAQPEAAPPADSEETGVETEATQDETPIGYDDLLPQRQAKQYPDQLLSLAAQKFGIDEQDLGKPSVRALLTGKINADILINQYNREQELRELDQRETVKPAVETKAPETSQPAANFSELSTMAERVATSIVTDEGSDYVGKHVFDALVNVQSARETNDPKQLSAAYRELNQTFTSLMVMGMAQILPQVSPGLIKASLPNLLPEFLTQHAESVQRQEAESWEAFDQAREILSKDVAYRDIGSLSGPDGPLAQAIEEIWEETGENLAEKQFIGRDGKPLPPVQNAIAGLKMAIRWIRSSGKPVDQVTQAAIRKGRELERKESQQNSLGRLGSGRTSGALDRTRGNEADDEMADMVEAMNRNEPVSLDSIAAQSRR